MFPLRSLACIIAAAFVSISALGAVPSDAEILDVLTERIGEHRERIGIVVGVIEPEGRRVLAFGSTGTEPGTPVDGDTVFEIGSVTKVFTALLLADMAARGDVGMDDPVAEHLPPGVAVPTRGGRLITLRDLAMHRSALPRLPGNMAPADIANPYADYSIEQLYAFLSSHELTRDIGAEYEYSNLGAGLLGHALARAANLDYETLVRERIATPLSMRSTAIALDAGLRERLATGHDARLSPVPNWDLPTLVGAGGLRSTANDMLSFLALFLGYERSTLETALPAMLEERRPAGPGLEIALGWHIRHRNSGDEGVIWHNGGTGGYRSFIGLDPIARTGVVVLTNVSLPGGVDDLGFHLLDPSFALLPPDSPLITPPRERTPITLLPEQLEPFVGRYELGPGVELVVTCDGGRLFADAAGQGRAEIFPESPMQFFVGAVDAEIVFQTDDQGRVQSLIIRQLGREQLARKLDGDATEPDEWFGHRLAEIDPGIYDAYVGRYQLTPSLVFTITRDGDALFAQLTGQPPLQVFPASQAFFFYKAVNAQLTFEPDETGRARALVLHQNGQDVRAERIE
jgi:serine-type D-Ala-D-Ala carboxypeptidase/endopeptidase